MRAPKCQVDIRLPEPVAEALRDEATRSRVSQGRIVQEALDQWFARKLNDEPRPIRFGIDSIDRVDRAAIKHRENKDDA